MKHLFVTLHFFLIASIFIASAALYVAFRPDGLDILNTYLLKPLGIHYSRSEGTLLRGFVLHDLHSDTMTAKQLSLQYNLVEMLQSDHVIDSVKIDGLRIHLDDFIEGGGSVWPFPVFRLERVEITDLQLIGAYPIELDLYAKNGSYDGSRLEFRVLDTVFRSQYASGALHGTLRHNAFSGVGDLYPNQSISPAVLREAIDLPPKLRLTISELSADKIAIHTDIPRLIYKTDPSIQAEEVKLDLNYAPQNGIMDINALYRLHHQNNSIALRHHVRYHPNGKIDTDFEGDISTQTLLPSNRLKGAFSLHQNHLEGILTLGESRLSLQSNDRNLFVWELNAYHSDLSFIPALPKNVSQSPARIIASGNYLLDESVLGGFVEAHHNHGELSGSFSIGSDHREFQGSLNLYDNAPTWKAWSHKPPQEIALSFIDDANRSLLEFKGDDLSLKATLENDDVIASGTYAGIHFKAIASLRNQKITIDSSIPSAFATLSKLNPTKLYDNELYDAEVYAQTQIHINEGFEIDSNITIPWYTAVFDSQNAYGGVDNHLQLHYKDGNITFERYRLDILNHTIGTEKISSMRLHPTEGVIIDELWLYDTLKLTGTVQSESNATFRIDSERFTYEGAEGNVQASVDLLFKIRGEDQSLSGSLKILSGSITNLPLQQFKVMDSDIIIIQDVRPPSDKRLGVNVHITSDEPIRFKTKEFDIRFTPDITLWKDPITPMQILGMVAIPSGTAATNGKNFTIKYSEIYFGGDIPLNPYLDFTVLHEVDYKKINIFITHTLEAPIFLFGSDPIMSQNDIMSYLLFGASSSESTGGFSGSIRTDTTNFMLGAGLKGLINGVTKIQIDTMNILTTADGGMGFEVGAKLNKNLRVLYKNNTVSTLLLQYNVNRWLRLDADIHELGQGINAIYIKDFRDILPHNAPVSIDKRIRP